VSEAPSTTEREFRVVVGLEVHVHLRTRTKCFCPCASSGGDQPNSRTCPVCLGLPGALPVLSRAALDLAVRAAVALGCDIAERTWWDRKHYGYADLPKGYQITQHTAPVGTNGVLRFDGATGPRELRIQRVHLEEDTGRSMHTADGTLLAFDRAGIPLLEVVTAPELDSAADVRACLLSLRRLLRWIGVSDAEMEHGQMRCEPNVNVLVRQGDAWVPTPIAEIKNLNSITAAARAVDFEVERQLAEFAVTGVAGPGPRSTRGWSDSAQQTVHQRVKEEAADYRFLPEPDLPVVTCAPELAEAARAAQTELPEERRRRYVDELGLDAASADVLTQSLALSNWFERSAGAAGDPRAVAPWIVGNVALVEAAIVHRRFSAKDLGKLVRAVERGRVPRDAARRVVLPEMAQSGTKWREIVAREELVIAGDVEVATAVRTAVDARADLADAIRAGRTQVLDVLVGDVMRATRGRADASVVRELLLGLVLGSADEAHRTDCDETLT